MKVRVTTIQFKDIDPKFPFGTYLLGFNSEHYNKLFKGEIIRLQLGDMMTIVELESETDRAASAA